MAYTCKYSIPSASQPHVLLGYTCGQALRVPSQACQQHLQDHQTWNTVILPVKIACQLLCIMTQSDTQTKSSRIPVEIVRDCACIFPADTLMNGPMLLRSIICNSEEVTEETMTMLSFSVVATEVFSGFGGLQHTIDKAYSSKLTVAPTKLCLNC